MTSAGRVKQLKKHWNLPLAAEYEAEGKFYRPAGTAAAASVGALKLNNMGAVLKKPGYAGFRYYSHVPGGGAYPRLSIRLVADPQKAYEQVIEGLTFANARDNATLMALGNRFGINPQTGPDQSGMNGIQKLAAQILQAAVSYDLDIFDKSKPNSLVDRGTFPPMNQLGYRRQAYEEEVNKEPAGGTTAARPSGLDEIKSDIIQRVTTTRAGGKQVTRGTRMKGPRKAGETGTTTRVIIGRGQDPYMKLLLLMDAKSQAANYPGVHTPPSEWFFETDGKTLKMGPKDIGYSALNRQTWATVPPLRLAARITQAKPGWDNLYTMLDTIMKGVSQNKRQLSAPMNIGGTVISNLSETAPVFQAYLNAASSMRRGTGGANAGHAALQQQFAQQQAAGPQQTFAQPQAPMQQSQQLQTTQIIVPGESKEAKLSARRQSLQTAPNVPRSPRGGATTVVAASVAPVASVAPAAALATSSGSPNTPQQAPGGGFAPGSGFGSAASQGGQAPGFQPQQQPFQSPSFQPTGSQFGGGAQVPPSL